MGSKSILVYDIEIAKAICGRGETREAGVEYCAGWDDKKNMGISVIGVYDYLEDRYRVFCEDNWSEFGDLVLQREIIVGFNQIRFDNVVVREVMGFHIPDSMCYDILLQIWLGMGMSIDHFTRAHGGFGLDPVSEKNLGAKKTGNGAKAPVFWQQGKVGTVIDYCLSDVWLTKCLFDIIVNSGSLMSPKDGTSISMRHPFS